MRHPVVLVDTTPRLCPLLGILVGALSQYQGSLLPQPEDLGIGPVKIE